MSKSFGKIFVLWYLDLFPVKVALDNVELAQGARRIYVKPLIYAAAVKMVVARELTQFGTIFIWAQADTAFLHLKWDNQIVWFE